MKFTANGKMKFPFCQNIEKLDLIKLFSCLLSRYIRRLLDISNNSSKVNPSHVSAYITLHGVTVALRLTLFHTCVLAMRLYISLVVNRPL